LTNPFLHCIIIERSKTILWKSTMARPRKNINICKLAEEAGVSHMTVSRVLNNRAGVSEAVRSKIQKLQEKYNYKTNYQTPVRSKIAMVIVEHQLSDYYNRILSGVMRCIQGKNVEVAMVWGQSGPEELLQQIRDMQCSAVIFPEGRKYDNLCSSLLKSNLPVILLDIQATLPKIGYIDNDSYVGSCEAAQYLLDQGHRNIGYMIHGSRLGGNHPQRVAGYKDTLKAAGIKVENNWIQAVNELEIELGIPYWDSVPYAIDRLFEKLPGMTALMLVDDNLALRAIGALQRKGYKIPEDISVVGFDNHTNSGDWFPSLTTVHHQLDEAGFKAAEALTHAINNPGNWDLPRIVLPTNLIVRDSVCKCNKK